MWSKLSLFCRNTCTQLCHILAEMNMIVGMLLRTVYSKGFIDNFLKCGELESYGLKETMTSLLISPVPERPITANTGLNFCSIFVFYLPVYCLE